MATGDQNDIQNRLRGYLPARWFGNPSDSMPIIDAVLTGVSACLSFIYSLYAYAKLQTRINTATGGWLDLIAFDFFGGALIRGQGQSDSAFRATIIAQILHANATRAAISAVVKQLTGQVPIITEGWQAQDTGAYGSLPAPCLSLAGYNVAGCYGSMAPCQFFVKTAAGLPGVTNADIYAAVAAATAAGIESWVCIA